MGSRNRRLEQWATWVVALLGPALITAGLERLSGSIQRDYVFIYLGLVAGVAVIRGLWPALLCAGISFLMVDYFFPPPFGTLTIADASRPTNEGGDEKCGQVHVARPAPPDAGRSARAATT